MTKRDWKKDEKMIYAPKAKPSLIRIPPFHYLTFSGEGAPASKNFQEAVQSLFSVAYTLKFSVRKGLVIQDYQDYAVYPLEGIWSITEAAIKRGSFTKEDLVYTLMIRQPEFIHDEHVAWAIEQAQKKHPALPLSKIMYTQVEDGSCVQMLHVGSFDTESLSFDQMKAYIKEHHLSQRVLEHREIYLSDFNKTSPEKLKTILRYFI